MRLFRTLCTVAFMLLLVIAIPGASAVDYQVLWEIPFNNTGTWSPIQFPDLPGDTGSLAQSFQTATPIVGVRIHSPSWSGTGAGYRMRLFAWNTDYATSITGTVLGERVLVNYPDNGAHELTLPVAVPAGSYLLVTDQPVPGTGAAGHWGWNASTAYGNPIPSAFSNGEPVDGLVFQIQLGTAVERIYETVEDFFTVGGTAPASLAAYPKIGQRFTATQPFEGVEVNGPTWSTNGQKGMTIRLYNWAGSYAATVAQTPLLTSVLTALNDNFWHPCVGTTTYPPGVYFFELSDPTNPGNPGDLAVGAWIEMESTYADGEAYLNGVLQTGGFVWKRVFAHESPGAWTPFAFVGFYPGASLAQTVETTEPIYGIGFQSPSWNGTGAGYRIGLYNWNTDFDTSYNGTPIKTQTFANYPDNGTNKMLLDNPVPPGNYLFMTDEPVQGTGNAGHWGWTGSPFNTGGDVPNSYFDGVKGTDFYDAPVFDVYYAVPGEGGPDVKSRSVRNPASIIEWSQY